jgi:small basic protein
MILAPKFSEFIALSILAFIHNKLVTALYLLVYCVLCVRKFHAGAAIRGV